MSAPAQWATISGLIDAHDLRGLVDRLGALTDTERAALVDPLARMEKDSPKYGHTGETRNGLTVASAGILSSPSTLAPWLVRGWFSYWSYHDTEGRQPDACHHVIDEIVEILLAREVAWIPALVARLAPRLPSNPDSWSRSFGGGDLHLLVETLRDAVDVEPPVTPGYLIGLLMQPFGIEWYVRKATVDPRFAALAPRFCDFDTVGLRLRQYTDRHDDAPAKLAAAAANGVLDRTALLDALIGRLQRGGRLGATQGFLGLYEALRPTVAECADRRRDLLVMVAEAPGVAAAVAQRQLVELDDAGQLPVADLVEASRAIFARTEKKIVKAQLAHITRSTPDDIDDLAAALGVLFEHRAVDLRRAGVRAVIGWAGRIGVAARSQVLVAADALPADLRAELHHALRSEPSGAEPTASTTPSLPKAPDPAAFEPIVELADLATEVVAMRRPFPDRSFDPIAFERVLEAVIRFVRPGKEGRTAVFDALGPTWPDVAGTGWGSGQEGSGSGQEGRIADLGHGLSAVIRAATRRSALPEHPPAAVESPMQGMVLDRLLRLAREVRARPGALLVSTPSDIRGVITPEDLLDRLRHADSDGWEPWPSDLEQAVLRLDVAAAVGHVGAEAFVALGSRAASAVAEWIASGGPSATTSLRAVKNYGGSWSTYRPRDDEPVPFRDRYGREPHLAASVDADAPDRFGSLWNAVLRVTPPRMYPPRDHQDHECWAMALPFHPDVVAAHQLGRLRSAVDGSTWRHDILRLADAPGPMGDALAAAVAYTMASAGLDQRASAADALLTRAARASRADPGAARVGRVLGDLVVGRLVALSRTLEPLRAATEGGAAAYTWAVYRELVAAVSVAPWTIAGAADLFAAAAECAAIADAGGVIDGLDDFASRKGGSRQLVEARRLRDLLSV